MPRAIESHNNGGSYGSVEGSDRRNKVYSEISIAFKQTDSLVLLSILAATGRCR
jgi:hypothetical protein